MLPPAACFNLSLVNQIGRPPVTVSSKAGGRGGMLLGIAEKFVGEKFVECIPNVFLEQNPLVIRASMF